VLSSTGERLASLLMWPRSSKARDEWKQVQTSSSEAVVKSFRNFESHLRNRHIIKN
jgi:hypothetical protein